MNYSREQSITKKLFHQTEQYLKHRFHVLKPKTEL